MARPEDCMIFKPAKRITPPTKNKRTSTPLCQNCLMTELYCSCVREMDARPCCTACEHVRLEAQPSQPAVSG